MIIGRGRDSARRLCNWRLNSNSLLIYSFAVSASRGTAITASAEVIHQDEYYYNVVAGKWSTM
jgi:hypothetical protein